jgi:hypothetical protein
LVVTIGTPACRAHSAILIGPCESSTTHVDALRVAPQQLIHRLAVARWNSGLRHFRQAIVSTVVTARCI